MYQDIVFSEQSKTGNPRNLISIFYSAEDLFPRAFGFLSDPNFFGIYMISVAVACIILLAHKKSVIVCYLTLPFSLGAMLLSLSRSSFISLFFFLAIFSILISRSKKNIFLLKGFYKKTLVFLLLIFLMCIIIYKLDINSILCGRVNQFFEGQRVSYYGHLDTRKNGILLFLISPFFGHGIGFNANPILSPNGELFGGSHCFWLDVLVGQGIAGSVCWLIFLISYLALFSSTINIHRNYLNWTNYITSTAAFSLFAAFLFANFLYHSFICEFIWFLTGLLAANAFRSQQGIKASKYQL